MPESQNGQNNLFFIFEQLLGMLIYLNFIILILMFLIDDASCKLFDIWSLLCESTPGVSLHWSLTLEEHIVAGILLKTR